jgi:ribonucleoside-diphosphate reductase alpha chain
MASAALRQLALRHGLKPGAKSLTPSMEKTSSAFHVGALRGLFDADGSVHGAQNNVETTALANSKGETVELTNSDLPTLQAAQRMLLRLGIASTLHPTATQHELVISGDNLILFADRIGFSDTRKNERLQLALSSDRRHLERERFTATVEAVTPDGSADVYDVTVAGVHAFDANGLYVHNCGEQPLPPYGCCDLGPIILNRFVRHPFGIGGEPMFDFDAFEEVVATQVRMLDNVLDVTFWPLPQQRAESAAKRRIGVGFTGLGNTLTLLKLRYDRAEGREMAAEIARRMRDAAYRASVALGKEKGAFPKFDADGYLAAGTFANRLPDDLKAEIRRHGLRNSHLLSIAPTGTVSLAFADNASNGIEPAFSWGYTRNKREADNSRSSYTVEDHAFRLYRALVDPTVTPDQPEGLPDYFVNALEMSAQDHVAMMQAVQPFVDTSISKTVNIPEDYPYDDFKDLYRQAWAAGLKGLATYRPNGIRGAVLEVAAAPKPAEAQAAAPAYDPMRTVIEKRPPGGLPAVAEKIEYWNNEGQQRLYLIVTFMPVPTGDGQGTVERAIEFFMPVGQSGESQQWITATMRMLSLAARGGFLDRALSDMRKVTWDRGPVRLGTYEKADGTHVPRWHDSEVAAIAYAIQNLIAERAQAAQASLFDADELPAAEPRFEPAALAPQVMAGKKCPECGAHAMIRKDGCDYCTQCGVVGRCG